MPRRYSRKSYPTKKYSYDKKLQTFSGLLTGGTQTAITLFIAQEAVILKGLRVNGAISDLATAGPSLFQWAIVTTREGYTPNTLNITNGDLYIPEQDVWCWGTGISSARSATDADWIYEFDTNPKTSRKLQEGDTLSLLVRSVSNGVASVTAQFFVGN